MATLRQQISTLLAQAPHSPRKLADEVDIKIRDVLHHLEHIRRSHKREFHVVAPECLKCGFVFEGRNKLSTPSRCPECRSERISEPVFWIAAQDG